MSFETQRDVEPPQEQKSYYHPNALIQDVAGGYQTPEEEAEILATSTAEHQELVKNMTERELKKSIDNPNTDLGKMMREKPKLDPNLLKALEQQTGFKVDNESESVN